ncbi:hypothetical protein [Nonomuraea jiangxiensis]|uniref:Uncharacterized protein n=1 Tax=Nonomuraea jiangxiensis TaxID=633440 RepID=A0A1G9N4U7_9ACTN|nr:hypothetical protein [Nonomuraea jiangxiensis]SDL81321.1 hypothetical protein SAMN05421869_13133 [Nonomuraea jiangxiensis]
MRIPVDGVGLPGKIMLVGELAHLLDERGQPTPSPTWTPPRRRRPLAPFEIAPTVPAPSRRAA